MEKAILKTLCYGDIFDYPLKAWEIHKWLISKKCDLKELDKPLNSLLTKGLIGKRKDYYFLCKRSALVKKREMRQMTSEKLIRRGVLVSQIFRIIPWVKMVGISGSLAMKNGEKKDDIDLFIVVEKGRLWFSRLLILFILSVLGLRRKRRENGQSTAGKICTNIILDVDHLAQYKNNIYIAHEILQLRLIWQKANIYQKYLEDNYRVFRYLPNWVSKTPIPEGVLTKKKKVRDFANLKGDNPFIDKLEKLSRFLQKKYMGKVTGLERVSDNALYFHPNDYNQSVLDKYQKLLKKLNI